MPAKFSNAPLATIDIPALKPSRFILEHANPPVLPYRDHEGRINLHLCTYSEKELARMLATHTQHVPKDKQDELKRWTKHARSWAHKEGPTWVREEATNTWVCSTGERLPERARAQLQPKAEDGHAVPLQREATEAVSRVASRVGSSEAERRRQMMANIAASKGGRKRPADGEGGGTPSKPSPAVAAEPKKVKVEDVARAAREERERRDAEKAVRRAEKEQKEKEKAERKAAKAARRAAKAERRANRAALASGDDEEEEEEASEEASEEESEDEDDSEQVFEDTMAKCDKVATKMRSALSSLVKPDGAAPPMPQPANMNPQLTMAPHQLVGLSWLYGLHKHKASGILADEMGLGKTVQAIALLAQLYSEGDRGPHLVVAPTSTLENWLREFAMWCPKLRVLKYHGSEQERAQLRGELCGGGFHVVLTTFKLFEQDSEKAGRERAIFKKLQLSYLVLDEAQQIKNSESRRYKNLTAVRSSHRLLLTGTPIENSPKELLALLAFLMPSTFAASGAKDGKKAGGMKEALVQLFQSLERAGEGHEVTAARAARIKKLMAPFVLRRLKEVRSPP